jgi:hypothetical protein
MNTRQYESVQSAMLDAACENLRKALYGSESCDIGGKIVKKGKTLYVKIRMDEATELREFDRMISE